MNPSQPSSYIHAEGNMGLLEERINSQPQGETRLLLQQLLSYAQKHHLTANSNMQENASHGHIRINLGLVKDGRTPAWQPESLVECEVILNVRKPLRLGELYLSQQLSAFPIEPTSSAHIGNTAGAFNPGLEQRLLTMQQGNQHQNQGSGLSAAHPVLSEFRSVPRGQRQSSKPLNQPDETSFTLEGDFSEGRQVSEQGVSTEHFYAYSALSRSVSSPPLQLGPARGSPMSMVQSTASYASYSSSGQESQAGSRWHGGLSPNRNSGFGSSAKPNVPKEGFETRRVPGTVGRTGNAPRGVPDGLATAAGLKSSSTNIGPTVGVIFPDGESQFDELSPNNALSWDFDRVGPAMDFWMLASSSPYPALHNSRIIDDTVASLNSRAGIDSLRNAAVVEPRLTSILETGQENQDSIMAEDAAPSTETTNPETDGNVGVEVDQDNTFLVVVGTELTNDPPITSTSNVEPPTAVTEGNSTASLTATAAQGRSQSVPL